MYNDIGKKFKGLAIGMFWTVAVLSAVAGLVLIMTENLIIGLPTLIVGPLSAWISSWIFYGFGEIIDTLKAIEENTEGSALSLKKQEKATKQAASASKKSAPAKQEVQKSAPKAKPQKVEEEEPEEDEEEYEGSEETPQVRCPKCHTEHDFDYPKCPNCGHKYE